jgi:pSer/pThr/pTyr-binding forkhead associated (FHA) protein
MRVKFVPLDCPRARSPTVITRLPVILTRSSRSGVPAAAGAVSPLHCEIDHCSGLLVVEDLNSRHGTFVNGVRVRRAYLWPGDKLTVGLASFAVRYKWPKLVPWRDAGLLGSAQPSPEAEVPPVVIAEFSQRAGTRAPRC